jgi:hypothetical protein
MQNNPSIVARIFHWFLYIILSIIGLGFVQAIDKNLLRIETDGGMMLCFVIGMFITTSVFAFCRRRKYQFSSHPIVICIVGFFSFAPGYLVAFLFSLSGAF